MARRVVAQAALGAMADQGVTVEALAEATGIPVLVLQHRLDARSPFTIDELELVGRVLGRRPSTFLE